jgi:hypothetical protein
MRPHPFSETRKAHVRELIELIERSGTQGMTVHTIQAVFGAKYGNTKKTIESYLEIADAMRLIVTDGIKWYGKDNLPRKNLNDYLLETYVGKP